MLVTGGTGFVGSHVVERLVSAGVPVRALVRATSDTRRLEALGVERFEGRLTDEASMRRAVHGVAVVVHLAALTRARTETEYERVNATGTRTLAQAAAAAEQPTRFVYLSSLAAAGPPVDGRPVQPDDTPRPITAYGRSKLAGETACLEQANGTGLEVVILRAPAVYGPRDRDLFTFFRLASFGLLPVPTGPARPLQLVHAEDLADAVARAACAPGVMGIAHIAEARAYPWEDVGRMVAEAVGRRAHVVRIPAALVTAAATVSEVLGRIAGRAPIFNRDKARELLAPGWLCETETARTRLGFSARIPLDEGLKRTAKWYRNEGWL